MQRPLLFGALTGAALFLLTSLLAKTTLDATWSIVFYGLTSAVAGIAAASKHASLSAHAFSALAFVGGVMVASYVAYGILYFSIPVAVLGSVSYLIGGFLPAFMRKRQESS